MRRLRQAITTIGFTIAFVAAGSVPALAGPLGRVDCEQNPNPACDLLAGRQRDKSSPNGRDDQTSGSGSRSGDATGSPEAGGDRIVGGNPKSANCSYKRSDYQPPADQVVLAAFIPPTFSGAAKTLTAAFIPSFAGDVHAGRLPGLAPGADGAWYVWKCEQAGFRDALYRPPVWIPNAPPAPGGPAGPSVPALAALARDRLGLPAPAIVASPAEEQLVNLPTWLWLDRSSWGRRSATASVPGVTVTAVARPTSVTWTMGDGSAVVCTGPGTPYSTGVDPAAASPDCGYTYRVSSTNRPDEQYAVSATVHWQITWSGAGQSGAFGDLTTTATVGLRVAEARALNTHPDTG